MELIGIAQLQPHPQNDEFFDPIVGEKWNKFLQSIETSGVLEPVIVTQDHIIVSGHQRLRACEELGIGEIPYEVRVYDDRDGLSKDQWILKDLIETNVCQRGEIGGNELKMVRRVDALCDIYGIRRGSGPQVKLSRESFTDAPSTLKEVCVKAGVTYTEYRNSQGLKNLDVAVIDKMDSGDVPISVAAKYISQLTPEQQRELVSMVPDGEIISKATVEQYIARIQELEDENKWYDETESDTSEQVDVLTRRIQDLEEDNERLRELNVLHAMKCTFHKLSLKRFLSTDR